MIPDKDLELIEKYISDELSAEEKTAFNTKKKHDKKFSVEIALRENLRVATTRIATAEFKANFNNIHHESINRSRKRMYVYFAYALSVAALVLLFFIVGNPLNDQIKINKHIAEAEKPKVLSVQRIAFTSIKSDEKSEPATFLDLEVAYIEKAKTHDEYNQYFFKENVLYLFKQKEDRIHFFYGVDTGGRRNIYLCRNEQMYQLNQTNEAGLLDLIPLDNQFYRDFCGKK